MLTNKFNHKNAWAVKKHKDLQSLESEAIAKTVRTTLNADDITTKIVSNAKKELEFHFENAQHSWAAMNSGQKACKEVSLGVLEMRTSKYVATGGGRGPKTKKTNQGGKEKISNECVF